jgi:ribonuclease Z
MLPFNVTILGSSSAVPSPARFTTSQLVSLNERLFLVDCGEGTQIQLQKFGKKMGRINHIFISHLHGDHIFGLPGLISSMSMGGKKGELHIYSHSDLQIILSTLMKFMNDLDLKVTFHPLNLRRHDVVYEDDKIKVESFPLKHRIPCCGFIFREQPQDLHLCKEKVLELNIPFLDRIRIKKGADLLLPDGAIIPNKELTLPAEKPRSFAYCTDTVMMEKIIPIIEGVDLLYHEATFSDTAKELAEKTYHSTSKQAALIALKANVGKLIIGHFSSRYKNVKLLVDEARDIFPNTYAVNDGDNYDIREDHQSVSF